MIAFDRGGAKYCPTWADSSDEGATEADLVCRQCLTEGSNFFRKWKTLSEFSDLFGIAILLSVHVSYVASLCVSLYTYGLHW